VKPGEKYSNVKEMHQKLKKSQHVIAQFYKENRELKRKLPEKTPEAQALENKANPKSETSKGILKNHETTVVSKPTTPLTRSSARNNSPRTQGKQAGSERPPTSPTEGEKNVRWLNKQLREAQDQIIKLSEEKRISDDRFMKHFKECIPTRQNASATLSNAQSKLKRNAALFK
jgi:hypothetical protein